ncbi:hypothetical protein GOV05_04895 [Candidatus Woesearchaeota archaeon]|nr:hypothetical protein [Candidatus Woesearchaeota archaeon]
MKTTKIITTLLILIILSISATASSLSVTQTNLEGMIKDTLSATITITNTGSDTISNLDVTTTGFSDFDFTTITDLSDTELDPSETATYRFQITIPTSESTNFDSHKIGEIIVSGENSTSSAVQASSDVNLVIESRLQISDVNIDVEGDTEDVKEGERIEAKRGDSVTLEIEVENKFSRSSNIDIEDIEVVVTSDGLDADEDDEVDVDSGEDEKVELTFIIEEDQDEGREEVEIMVFGYDDEGTYHEYTFTFDIDVEVKSREVLIRELSFTPSVISCDRRTTLNVEIKNSGSRDLEEAMVLIKADDPDWEITEYLRNIVIDESDTKRVSFRLSVPEDIPEGNYLFNVNSYYSGSTSDKSDTDIVTLEVISCKSSTPPTTGDDDDSSTIIIDTPISTPSIPTGAVFATQKSQKTSLFSGEGLEIILVLVLANIVLIGGVLMLLNAINNKKEHY